MHKTLKGLGARRVAIVVAVVAAWFGISGNWTVANAAPMRFGADIEGLGRAQAHGLPFTYGTFWIGSWTQRWGWGNTQQKLRTAAANNITPVINWWYWGDDISPQCVEQGCWDARQGVWKDKATWYRMTDELARTIAMTMGGRETVVVIETEFNKGGIENYEPFDGYLAEQAAILRAHGANIRVVLGFGNWGRESWSRFDRAIAASDLMGVQLMRSSIRDAATYGHAISTLVSSVQYLRSAFAKPSIVTDLALSSFPTAGYEGVQAQVVAELFARMPELKSAGVQAVLYRMVVDDPSFDTSNYHGEAERHWGLLRADGSQKPAFSVFAAGIREENSAASGPSCDAPGAPQNFGFNVEGSIVTLQWGAPASGRTPASYLIEAGTAPGVANLAVFPFGGTAVRVMAPAGTYFVRIRAQNPCGIGGASNEQIIRVQ